MYEEVGYKALKEKLLDDNKVDIHSFLLGWKPPFLREPPPPPLSGYPPLSEANLKSYPLFLRTIQIGV